MGKPLLSFVCMTLLSAVYAAVPGDKITNLPGLPDGVTFDMYSGFLDGGYVKNDTADKVHNFYWQEKAHSSLENFPLQARRIPRPRLARSADHSLAQRRPRLQFTRRILH